MISCWFRLEKYLNYLLIFLLPTQLALHFWPPFAFVFGIRVDYLAPSIYLTDILFLSVFTIWIRSHYQKFFEFVGKYKIYIILFVSLAVVNTAFSTSVFPSIYKWLKLSELAVFYFYVRERRDIFNSKAIFSILFYSLVFFSLIGICQFFFGRTIGGPLFFLGERNFSISTPGIALAEIFGRSFMRAYSTFSHPNSLAGYLGLGLLVLLSKHLKKVTQGKGLGILVVCVAFVLTFSVSAFVGVVSCVVLFLLIRKRFFKTKYIIYLPGIFLFIGLIFPFFSMFVVQKGFSFPQNISQRIELSFGAASMVSQRFLLGEGLNTFVVNEPRIEYFGTNLWILQPVHNIFLLIFSETGILGLLCFYVLLVRLTRKAILSNDKLFYLVLVFILVTGLVDHYWFTLQQNMFFLTFVLGNSFGAES